MKFLNNLLSRILSSYREISDAIDIGTLSKLSTIDLGIMNYSTGETIEGRRIIGEIYKPIPVEWENMMTDAIRPQAVAVALTSVVIVEKIRRAA